MNTLFRFNYYGKLLIAIIKFKLSSLKKYSIIFCRLYRLQGILIILVEMVVPGIHLNH